MGVDVAFLVFIWESHEFFNSVNGLKMIAT